MKALRKRQGKGGVGHGFVESVVAADVVEDDDCDDKG
jgi:hypothetical protein